MHENTALNTDLLKEELGFSGFLISDWEGIDKLPGGTYAEKVVRSVYSGLDMAMAPFNFGAFITSVETRSAAVRSASPAWMTRRGASSPRSSNSACSRTP